MTKESLLMQYQSECRNALESAVNISKSFQKVFMDAMKLFMAIPDRINFLQMGRYGCFSEQTYRNNFENDKKLQSHCLESLQTRTDQTSICTSINQ